MNKSQIQKYIRNICTESLKASQIARTINPANKNKVLNILIKELKSNSSTIIKKNSLDIDNAKANKLTEAMIDRLLINQDRIRSMIDGLRKIISIKDTLFRTINKKIQPSGIVVEQMRVPLGVIAMIYESRPNVTIDAAGLSLKSSNSIILRGGSEAFNSNMALSQLIKKSLLSCKLPSSLVQLLKTTDRQAVTELLKMNEFVDVIIPRGGKKLIKKIANESTIPVIKHLDGNCHVYIDKHADYKVAKECSINSKTQRYGVCNAAETLLIHDKFPTKKILSILTELFQLGVEIRGCSKTKKIFSATIKARESDWYEEYLKPIISVKIVKSIDEAINHIEKYGSRHTDCIITQNAEAKNRFLKEVDSSSVMINTSTRFADGFEYGLGAEIGISTDKIHARGPVGLDGLTNLKYVVRSKGVIRN